MDHIGIERRIRAEPERFAAVLGTRPRARILIEASTDSEWVARCLEALAELLPGFVLVAPSRCLILRALPVQIDQQGFEVLPSRRESSAGR